MEQIRYDSKKLVDFYDARAKSCDPDLAQYGNNNGVITDPTRYYIFHQTLLNLIKSKVPVGASLIDVGCGPGIVAEAIVENTRQYVGVDISLPRIKQAQAKLKNRRCFFVVADAARLPFKDFSFDTAMGIEVVEHLPDTELFIQEIHRVIKNTGLMILSTPATLIFEDKRGRLYQDQHVYEFTPGKLKSLIQKGGFHINAVIGLGFKVLILRVPLWMGSNYIKYFYHKITRRNLISGYGYPISVKVDILSNPFLNSLYFRLRTKQLWFFLIKALSCFGKNFPAFSSIMVVLCEK